LGLSAMLLLFGGASLPAQEQSGDFHFNMEPVKYTENVHRNPCQVFIGVVTNAVPGGLQVENALENTPATTYDVRKGDVITAMDGVPVATYGELVRVRDQHAQGEAFALSILRDGQPMTIHARFRECSKEEEEKYQLQKEALELTIARSMEQMHRKNFEAQYFNGKDFSKMEWAERPILGVFEADESNGQGLVIGRVIKGKGAEAAGLQAGDVITAVNGKTVTGTPGLRLIMAGLKPGERVIVAYRRDGQDQQTEVTLSADRSPAVANTERDPCAVFIGVYTAEQGAGGRGVQVVNIVPETPASLSGIQQGDLILALDDQPVNTTGALLHERDKHRPGDAFRLTIERDGVTFTIESKFKTCPAPDAPAKEPVQVAEQQKVSEERTTGPVQTGSVLVLPTLEAYPNPTTGPVNVRFEAEAVPTILRILDVTGKAVYTRNLNQFNGSFSESINLFGNTPGTYLLSIQQGDKVVSKKILLVPGA